MDLFALHNFSPISSSEFTCYKYVFRYEDQVNSTYIMLPYVTVMRPPVTVRIRSDMQSLPPKKLWSDGLILNWGRGVC